MEPKHHQMQDKTQVLTLKLTDTSIGNNKNMGTNRNIWVWENMQKHYHRWNVTSHHSSFTSLTIWNYLTFITRQLFLAGKNFSSLDNDFSWDNFFQLIAFAHKIIFSHRIIFSHWKKTFSHWMNFSHWRRWDRLGKI